MSTSHIEILYGICGVILLRYDILKYDRIRALRVDRDLTQKQVAEALKIAPNTLSQYETGARNIPNEILIKFAYLYNTSTDYLLGLTDEKKAYKRSRV